MKIISEAFGRRLKGTDVTRIQWIAMYYLNKHREMKQVQLATMMNLKPSTVTRLLDRMENNGLSERYSNPDSKREIIIKLTEKGNKTIEKLLPYGNTFNEDLVRDISPDDLVTFQKVMDKMLNNIIGATPIK
jgi:DNA-binding MarR family transcriptional regulator